MPLVPHVSSGQIVASSWGNLVADHVVMRFTTAAQRASQLTSPILNQLTLTDDRPVIQRWTGSAWADIQPFVQAAATAVTFDASGLATVTFPSPFAAAPVVVAGSAHAGLNVVVAVDQAGGGVTATNCRLSARIANTAAAFTSAMWISYIATGLRP